VVEQLVDVDRAVVRPVRVHVEVGDDPVAALERRRAFGGASASAGQRVVDPLHLVRERAEALALGRGPALVGAACAERAVLHEARSLGGGELGLELAPVRRRDRRARGLRLDEHAREAVERRHEHRRFVEERGAALGVACGTHADAAAQRARQRGPSAERTGAQQHELPVGLSTQLAYERSQQRPLRLPPLEHDHLLLLRRGEELGVDAERHDLVTAGEAELGGLSRLGARGEQRVEPAQQALALRLARRVREPLRREEGRGREGGRVAKRQVREARQPRLEAVHDVEAGLQGEREVRPHADRHAHAAAARDRHRGAEGDELGIEAVPERAASRCEVAGPVGRGEHGDRVPARA
jgi:hypothetical protein